MLRRRRKIAAELKAARRDPDIMAWFAERLSHFIFQQARRDLRYKLKRGHAVEWLMSPWGIAYLQVISGCDLKETREAVCKWIIREIGIRNAREIPILFTGEDGGLFDVEIYFRDTDSAEWPKPPCADESIGLIL